MKAIEYINDPFKYIDVFKLRCYHYLEKYDVYYSTFMYFDNKTEFYPYFERIILLQNKLKQWKKWMDDSVHSEEQYQSEWHGEENKIIPEFQEIYSKIQNYAIEQFPFIDNMNLNDSGFTLLYINQLGHECTLEV